MFENLKEAESKFDAISEDLTRVEVISDTERFTKLMKEHKLLSPIIEKYREYRKCESDIESAKLLLEEETDRELCEMCENEIKENKEKLAILEDELRILLLPKDEDDDKNVIVEIRAGTGGDEAALFAGSLYRMYSMYAESCRFKCELLGANESFLISSSLFPLQVISRISVFSSIIICKISFHNQNSAFLSLSVRSAVRKASITSPILPSMTASSEYMVSPILWSVSLPWGKL